MIRFDDDITGTAVGLIGVDIHLSDDWSINGIPNGGYLMSILANAMPVRHEPGSAAIVTANFISRCAPGRARIEVEPIAASRQFDRYQVRLFQNDRECVRALGTLANLDGHLPLTRYESPPPDLAPLDDCILYQEMPGYTFYDHVEVRMDPASAGWMQNRLVPKSELKGWVKIKGHTSYDLPKILIVADAFPPPVFASQGRVAWVPTIELSVNIRSIPLTRWLHCRFRTRFVTAGLLEEDGEVWDTEGNLVAVSRQIAQYRNEG